MEEANQLVSVLQAKLAELDTKVCKYQEEMADAFTKYSNDLLRNVPKEVSEHVNKFISAEIHNHPFLQPAAIDSAKSTSSYSVVKTQNNPDLAQSTQTLRRIHTSEPKDEMAERGLHDRDEEFRGLFTPPYLPLLDGMSEGSPSPIAAVPLSPMVKSSRGRREPYRLGSVDAGTSTTRSLVASPDFLRPSSRRKNTDKAWFMTDGSNGVPRSALRRPSTTSSSKQQSPRQVRFDVIGGEVLPTSSPQPHENIYSTDIPHSSDGHEDSGDEYGSYGSNGSYRSFPDDHKKVTTLDKLKALTRQPIPDDGVVWTTHNQEGLGGVTEDDNSDDENSVVSHIEEVGPKPIARYYGKSLEEEAEEAIAAADSDSSDDDQIYFGPKKKQAPVAPAETSSTATSMSKQSPVSTTSPGNALLGSQEVKEGVDDEYQLPFDFDDSQTPTTAAKAQSTRTRDDSDSEKSEPSSPVHKSPLNLLSASISDYTNLPALHIATAASPVATTSSGTVGSFRGHAFHMPIVNEHVYAQAASLGNIQSHIGSIDGRTGVDESNIQSFRESFRCGGSSFSGAPRSLSERMAMEDLAEGNEDEYEVNGHLD
ncbi:hypothetical protein BJ878DRAFT_455558 [Calycina marina]|uniref:Uncharacterized protein n=1 Tax=Calycina marina TaxID=1763456 RepID=A0A9P8CHI4_9HELO|nr:hypothetical protein BJ878DRAFT_455558 [Calycina marina]